MIPSAIIIASTLLLTTGQVASSPSINPVEAVTKSALEPGLVYDFGKGNTQWYNFVTKQSQDEPPFEKYQDAEGQLYYKDPKTGEATWDAPVELAWKRHDSELYPGYSFWHNEVSGESTWEVPEDAAWQPFEKGFYYNEVTGESIVGPPPYVTLHDDENDKPYYVDTKTQEVMWELPEAYSWIPVNDTETNKTYFFNPKTNASQWEKPAEIGWTHRSIVKYFWWNTVTHQSTRARPAAAGYDDGQGSKFYVGKDGESTWEAPHPWVELKNEEGLTYYVNKETREAVWETPEDMAWVMIHEEL